jgi:hypothetical protein
MKFIVYETLDLNSSNYIFDNWKASFGVDDFSFKAEDQSDRRTGVFGGRILVVSSLPGNANNVAKANEAIKNALDQLRIPDFY